MAIPRKTLFAAAAAALLLGGCATGPYYGGYGYGYDYYGYGPAYYDPVYVGPSVGFGYSYYDHDGRRHWRGDRDHDGRRDWHGRGDRGDRGPRPTPPAADAGVPPPPADRLHLDRQDYGQHSRG